MKRNKIESAIYDIKLHIKDREIKLLYIQAELKSLKIHLEVLESIEKDEEIPHEVYKSEAELPTTKEEEQ